MDEANLDEVAQFVIQHRLHESLNLGVCEHSRSRDTSSHFQHTAGTTIVPLLVRLVGPATDRRRLHRMDMARPIHLRLSPQHISGACHGQLTQGGRLLRAFAFDRPRFVTCHGLVSPPACDAVLLIREPKSQKCHSVTCWSALYNQASRAPLLS